VVCKGAGAGVLKDVDLMIRLTKAVINSTDLPVTVKTRLGWDDIRLILMRWQSGFKISELPL
jgi:tRNA-dihydrouridine synthase